MRAMSATYFERKTRCRKAARSPPNRPRGHARPSTISSCSRARYPASAPGNGRCRARPCWSRACLPGIADRCRHQPAGQDRQQRRKSSLCRTGRYLDRHVVGFPPGHDVALRHAPFSSPAGRQTTGRDRRPLTTRPILRAMRIWQHRTESTASYAAGSDASSLFDKTHPRIAPNVKILQHSTFCRYSPARRRDGGFPGSWQARQPPLVSTKRMTHHSRAKGLLTPADTPRPRFPLWWPWNRTHLERIVKEEERRTPTNASGWSSYLYVAGIALVIMVCNCRSWWMAACPVVMRRASPCGSGSSAEHAT